MVAIRYIGGAVLGLGASFGVWLAIALAHPIFRQLALSGLVPGIAAGVVGGLVAGALAPGHKVAFSAVVGFMLAGALLGGMVVAHMHPVQRNPFLWYWPAYLLPSFVVGGILSRGVWKRAA